METTEHPVLSAAEQCGAIHKICAQMQIRSSRYMGLFDHLVQHNTGSWESYLRGASGLTMYPHHDAIGSFWALFPSDEEAIREDWEAVGGDIWGSILAVTQEQPHEQSTTEDFWPNQTARR